MVETAKYGCGMDNFYEVSLYACFSGGGEYASSMLDLTRGHFNQSFTGCFRNIVVQNDPFDASEDPAKSGVVGRNVGSCGAAAAITQPQQTPSNPDEGDGGAT